MISRNFRLRFLTAAVGLPLFFVLIYLLPHLHHLGFNLLVTAATVLGALELDRLLRARGLAAFGFSPYLAALLPAAAYLQVSGLLPRGALWAALAGLVMLVLAASLMVRREEDLHPMLARTAASLLVLLYPGLFAAFVVLLSGLPEASLRLLMFFSLVFVDDLLAYTAGGLARGWSRLHWAVSPNKVGDRLRRRHGRRGRRRGVVPRLGAAAPAGWIPGGDRLRRRHRGADYSGRLGGVGLEALGAGQGLQRGDPGARRGAGFHRFLAAGRTRVLSVFPLGLARPVVLKYI